MKARITKLESKQDTTTVHLSWSGDDATVHDFDLDALGTKARVPSPAGGDLRSGWVVLDGACRLAVGDQIADTRSRLTYFVITPSNSVWGPLESLEEAQMEIPDSHDVAAHDQTTDVKACVAAIRGSSSGGNLAQIEHLETWLDDPDSDPETCGYLIFSAAPSSI